ncbi:MULTISPECIES: hypothetical protein [unclassified Microbacterium]|uniref:hypothetical protein n=1 Tax=unclassified Microbacterium TaxID=2609290 RepID=UPI00365B35D2
MSRPWRIFWAVWAVASVAVAVWLAVLSGTPIWFVLGLVACALLGGVVWLVARAFAR